MSGPVNQTHCQKAAEFVKSPKAEKALGGTLLLASGTTLAVTVLKGAAVVAAFGGPVGFIAFVGLAAIIGLGLLIHGFNRADALKERVAPMQQQEQQPAPAPSSAPVEQQQQQEQPAAPASSSAPSSSVEQQQEQQEQQASSTNKTAETVADVATSQLVVVGGSSKVEEEQVESETFEDAIDDQAETSSTAKLEETVVNSKEQPAADSAVLEDEAIVDDQAETSSTAKSEETVVNSKEQSAADGAVLEDEEGYDIDRLLGERPYADVDSAENATLPTELVKKLREMLKNAPEFPNPYYSSEPPSPRNLKENNFSLEASSAGNSPRDGNEILRDLLKSRPEIAFKWNYLKGSNFETVFEQLQSLAEKQEKGEDLIETLDQIGKNWNALPAGFGKSSLRALWAAILSSYNSEDLKERLLDAKEHVREFPNSFKKLVLAAKALTTDSEKLEVLDALLVPRKPKEPQVVSRGIGAKVIIPAAVVALVAARVGTKIYSLSLEDGNKDKGYAELVQLAISQDAQLVASYGKYLYDGAVNSQFANAVATHLGGFFTQTVPGVGQAIAEGLRAFGSKAVGGFQSAGSAVVSAGSSVVGGVQSAGSSVVGGVQSVGSAVVSAGSSVLGRLWSNQTASNA